MVRGAPASPEHERDRERDEPGPPLDEVSDERPDEGDDVEGDGERREEEELAKVHHQKALMRVKTRRSAQGGGVIKVFVGVGGREGWGFGSVARDEGVAEEAGGGLTAMRISHVAARLRAWASWSIAWGVT